MQKKGNRKTLLPIVFCFFLRKQKNEPPLTPALARRQEARTGSKGAGMGTTGRSLVLMPRCWRDMCECSELRDLATVPHSTHR